MDAQMLAEVKALALKTARDAGKLIRDIRQTGDFQQHYKARKELVTSADVAADQLIASSILERFPDHRILSEETYTDREQTKDLERPLWIIDPIDGTVNYAHGQQMVAVSIAFAMEGEVQFGVVYNPFLEETFSATLGQGSEFNGEKIEVSHRQDLRQSLVATGFPYDKTTVPMLLNRIQKVLMECQDIRRLGSAALDICWVACGRLDGYFESLSPWDFAAARLIALEAGARCGHFNPIPDDTPACIYDQNLLISTPEIYQALDDLLE